MKVQLIGLIVILAIFAKSNAAYLPVMAVLT